MPRSMVTSGMGNPRIKPCDKTLYKSTATLLTLLYGEVLSLVCGRVHEALLPPTDRATRYVAVKIMSTVEQVVQQIQNKSK